MTTIQRIERELQTLPYLARKEALDFVLFLKEKQKKASAPQLKPSVVEELQQAEREWENGEAYTFATSEEAIKFLDDLTVKS